MRPDQQARADHRGDREGVARRDPGPAAGPSPSAQPLGLADHSVDPRVEVPDDLVEESGDLVIGHHVSSLARPGASLLEQVLL
jgi:hypothetical protein